MQDRHEVMTTRGGKPVGLDFVGMRPVVATSVDGLFSWGTQNKPEITLRRNLVPMLLAAADPASDRRGQRRELHRQDGEARARPR